jgi:hypothetical protein
VSERIFGCHKHDPLGVRPFAEGETCPHCAEDAKILEEKIGAVVDFIVPPPSGFDPLSLLTDIAARRKDCAAALRELVREVRR